MLLACSGGASAERTIVAKGLMIYIPRVLLSSNFFTVYIHEKKFQFLTLRCLCVSLYTSSQTPFRRIMNMTRRQSSLEYSTDLASVAIDVCTGRREGYFLEGKKT